MRKVLFVLALSMAVPCAGFGATAIESLQTSADKQASQSPELATASKLTDQALSMHKQKLYDGALLLAKQALEIREKVLGPDHELVATSLVNIASIYVAQDKYANAEPLLRRALRILERRFGADSKYLADALEHLAVVRFGLRDNGESERLYLRALAINETTFGPDALETARTIGRLGILYERLDKKGKAADYFKRSLTIKERVLGPIHLEVAEALDNCACTIIANGQTDEGKRYQERARAIRNSAENETTITPGGLLRGFATLMVEPGYPDSAKQQRIGGPVVIQVIVDECGRVASAKRLSGRIELESASLAAARRWRFMPQRIGTRRVKTIGIITFNFNL